MARLLATFSRSPRLPVLSLDSSSVTSSVTVPRAAPLVGGYFIGAGIMLTGGLVALFMGVDAEGKGLEAITDPLSRDRAKKSAARQAE